MREWNRRKTRSVSVTCKTIRSFERNFILHETGRMLWVICNVILYSLVLISLLWSSPKAVATVIYTCIELLNDWFKSKLSWKFILVNLSDIASLKLDQFIFY